MYAAILITATPGPLDSAPHDAFHFPRYAYEQRSRLHNVMSGTPTLSFNGDFHFINHDASSLKASNHRHAVLTHVQSKYHPWRRQKEARQLRASARIPKQKCDNSAAGIPRQSSDSNSSLLHASPLTLLRKGNSDPFNAFSLHVDAEVNALMCFERDYLHPAWYGAALQYAPSIERSTSDWSDVVKSLYKTSTAYGYLARTAIVLASVLPNSNYARTALIFRTRSSKLIRAELDRTDNSLYDEQLYRSIWALLQAELFDHNFAAAAVHTKMLESLFKLHQASHRPELDHSFIYNVVRNDVQRAAMSLSLPVFDMKSDGWAACYFNPAWQDLISVLPPLPAVATVDLDACLWNNDMLCALFIDARGLLYVLRALMTNASLATESNWVCFALRVALLQGRLIARFVDFTLEPSSETDGCTQLAPGLSYDSYMQAYACLAAVYWIRRAGNIDRFRVGNNPPIYNAGLTILVALREALTLSEAQATQADEVLHANLRLWALHVGATAEQAGVLNGDDPDVPQAWFTVQLAAQIRSMGIASWQGCREVLLGFLYSDMVQPQGSTWFSKLSHIGK